MAYDPVARQQDYEARKPYYREYYQKRQEAAKAYQKSWRRNNRELRMLHKAQERAKRDGIPCTITVVDIVIPETCPVFGMPLVWSDALTDDKPTLDRIVPSLGYVPGNVMVISYRANHLKNDATLTELKQLVAWLESL